MTRYHSMRIVCWLVSAIAIFTMLALLPTDKAVEPTVVGTEIRKACFEHIVQAQAEQAYIDMSTCSLLLITEFGSAGPVCQQHMLATGNVCQE